MSLRFVLPLAATVLLLPAPSRAQVTERPPRSAGGIFGGAGQPLDPNRTRSTLSMRLDAFGGWDDEFLSVGGLDIVGGYVGLGSARLLFTRGRAARSFDMTARTHLTSYPRSGIDPLVGGDAAIRGRARVGRGGQISGAISGAYEPSLTLSAYSPVQGQVDSGVVANGDPSRGAASLSSMTISAAAGMSQQWTPRHRTGVTYQATDRQFDDASLVVSEYDGSLSRSVSADYGWNFSRSAALVTAYQFSNQRLDEVTGIARSTNAHAGEVGFNVSRTLSRTRALSLTVRGGATYVETVSVIDRVPYDYVAPSGTAAVRLDVGRTWGLAADYRRSVTVIDGISLGTFLTDAATVTIGGDVAGGLSMALSGAVSNGRAQVIDVGSFESRIVTAQVQYALSRCCSLVSSYTYYDYELKELTTIPAGFPARFDRDSVRVGVSVDLPLYGNFSAPGN